MPLDIGFALVLLERRRLSFRPYTFPDKLSTVIVRRETVHYGDFRFDRSQKSHLGHELYPPLESVGAMTLIRIEMKFGGNAHAAKLPVDQGGAVWRVIIDSAMMQADGACLFIELEDAAQFHIRAIALGNRRAVEHHPGIGFPDLPIDKRHFLITHDGHQTVHLMTGWYLTVLKAETPGIDQRRHRDIKGTLRLL